jgi:ABC-type uncharacterized transport system permease subunit
MQEQNFFSIQEVKILVLSAVLAVLGGFAKLFMTSRRLTLYQFFSCSLVSGFTGIMASFLVRYLSLPPYLQAFVIGMTGFAGPAALSAFTSIYERKLGIRLNGDSPEK